MSVSSGSRTCLSWKDLSSKRPVFTARSQRTRCTFIETVGHSPARFKSAFAFVGLAHSQVVLCRYSRLTAAWVAHGEW